MSDKPFRFIHYDGERIEIPESGDNWQKTLDTIGKLVGGRVLAIQGQGAEIHPVHGRRELYEVTCAQIGDTGIMKGKLGSVSARVFLSYR